MKNASLRRIACGGFALSLLLLAGCHDYSWRSDFAGPVDHGLNEARILEHSFSINSNAYSFFVPGELGVISLIAYNPAAVALNYSLSASVAGAIDTPTITPVDSEHTTISFRPDETALGQDVVFTVSVAGATNGYVYPDYVFTLPCHYPEGNGFDVTFDFPDATGGALVLTPSMTVVLKSALPVNIGPSSGFDATGCSFAWYVDGSPQGTTTPPFSFNPAAWAVGDHIVSVVITRGKSVWSANVRITVEAI
jgi:hypothetical protein